MEAKFQGKISKNNAKEELTLNYESSVGTNY